MFQSLVKVINPSCKTPYNHHFAKHQSPCLNSMNNAEKPVWGVRAMILYSTPHFTNIIDVNHPLSELTHSEIYSALFSSPNLVLLKSHSIKILERFQNILSLMSRR